MLASLAGLANAMYLQLRAALGGNALVQQAVRLALQYFVRRCCFDYVIAAIQPLSVALLLLVCDLFTLNSPLRCKHVADVMTTLHCGGVCQYWRMSRPIGSTHWNLDERSLHTSDTGSFRAAPGAEKHV